MNIRLARICVLLWLAGFLAMAVVRGIFGVEPSALAFGVSAWITGIGGATYCLLGVLCCACRDESV